MIEELATALINVANNCDELADEAIAHAEKILTTPATPRDIAAGIEICNKYYDLLGEILTDFLENSDIEYQPMSI